MSDKFEDIYDDFWKLLYSIYGRLDIPMHYHDGQLGLVLNLSDQMFDSLIKEFRKPK